MSEKNREDCKWLEIIPKYYDEPSRCLCHLTHMSNRIDTSKDCAKCKSYEKKDEKDA